MFGNKSHEKPTSKQLNYARHLGITVPRKASKWEVSDLIDNALNSREPGGETSNRSSGGFKAWVRRKMIQFMLLCIIAIATVIAIVFAF